MVKMTNIQKNGTVVSLHCIPENKEENSFDFSFCLDTKKIICLAGGDKWYAGHAMTALRQEWSQTGTVPETLESQWC